MNVIHISYGIITIITPKNCVYYSGDFMVLQANNVSI